MKCELAIIASPRPVQLSPFLRVADSSYQRIGRETQIIRQDATAVIQSAIDEVNRKAAKLDGITFVDVQKFGRVVFFVPAPTGIEDVSPHQPGSMDVENWYLVPPANSTRNDWTDRFALAQEFTYRYSLQKIEKVEMGSPLAVAFTVTVESSQRHAVTEQSRPLPRPPREMELWSPSNRLSGMYGLHDPPMVASLPAPLWPPGCSADRTTDKLAVQAVKKMRDESITKSSETIEGTARYDPKREKWLLSMPPGKLPQPVAQYWEQGLSDSDRMYVHDPEYVQPPKTSSQPASSAVSEKK